jgi:hypothetical protein
VSGGRLLEPFYRTGHNDIQINAVGYANPVEGFDVSYNTGFELGISASGECEFIEIDVMKDTTVQFNRAWKVSRNCGGITAKPISDTSDFVHNLVRWNYIQELPRDDLSNVGDTLTVTMRSWEITWRSYAYGIRAGPQ